MAPGLRIWMTPPNAHLQVAPMVRAGFPPISVCVAPSPRRDRRGDARHRGQHPERCRRRRRDRRVGQARAHAERRDVGPRQDVGDRRRRLALDQHAASGRTSSVDGASPKLHCSIAVATAAGLPIGPPRHCRRPRTDCVSCSPCRGDEAHRRAVLVLLPAARRRQQVGEVQARSRGSRRPRSPRTPPRTRRRRTTSAPPRRGTRPASVRARVGVRGSAYASCSCGMSHVHPVQRGELVVISSGAGKQSPTLTSNTETWSLSSPVEQRAARERPDDAAADSPAPRATPRTNLHLASRAAA